MRHTATVLTLFLLFFVAGCSALGPAPDTRLSGKNTTYTGSIPCADCDAQKLTVTFFGNKTFRLKRVFTGLQGGGSKTVYDLGTWKERGNRLVLDNGGRWPLQFRSVSGTEIEMLDQRGNPIVSKLDYSLRKTAFVDMLPGPMTMKGEFLYMADASTFTECQTGRKYPLLFATSTSSVEKQYLAARSAPGKPVLVMLKGRFAMQKPAAGAIPREYIVVQKFIRFWRSGTCANP